MLTGAEFGIVIAEIEPVETEGVIVGDRQRIGQIGLFESQAEAIGIGEAQLLALQNRQSRGIPVYRTSVGGNRTKGPTQRDGSCAQRLLSGRASSSGGDRDQPQREYDRQPTHQGSTTVI